MEVHGKGTFYALVLLALYGTYSVVNLAQKPVWNPPPGEQLEKNNAGSVSNNLLHQFGQQGNLAQRLRPFLVAPERAPYNFSWYKVGANMHASQRSVGQSKWVDMVLQQARDLFVVESGAYNGESLSNSLFFETERNWDCLLVEPNPFLQQEILAKHRKCFVLRSGLSITNDISSFPFRLAGADGGFTETFTDVHEWRLATMRNKTRKLNRTLPQDFLDKVIEVKAVPLGWVMAALGRTTIDYWSLDTEGSELSILQQVNFSAIEIGIITVEIDRTVERQVAINTLLEGKGFKLVGMKKGDYFYVNLRYFKKRRLPFPTTTDA